MSRSWKAPGDQSAVLDAIVVVDGLALDDWLAISGAEINGTDHRRDGRELTGWEGWEKGGSRADSMDQWETRIGAMEDRGRRWRRDGSRERRKASQKKGRMGWSGQEWDDEEGKKRA